MGVKLSTCEFVTLATVGCLGPLIYSCGPSWIISLPIACWKLGRGYYAQYASKREIDTYQQELLEIQAEIHFRKAKFHAWCCVPIIGTFIAFHKYP